MRTDQTVSEMVDDVLKRQAEVLVERSGCSLEEALQGVLQTHAGRQLTELKEGPHGHQKARQWHRHLILERGFERLEHIPKTFDDVSLRLRDEEQSHSYYYSWVEGYMERLKGKEEREEYYARLEGE